MYKIRNLIIMLVFLLAIGLVNLYAEAQNNQLSQGDAKVLVTPWPKYEFTDAADLNSILIKGSWIGDTGGNFVYDGKPIVNTVEIICSKVTGACIESRAEVSPASGNLMVRSVEYKITKWDKDGVEAYQVSEPYNVMGHSIGAGKLTLHIDRNNKTAALFGEYETDGTKGIWNAHLDSGVKLMEIYKRNKNEL
ncbi:MAG: hypothetical protein NTZ48_07560 [Candidatus Omnitrophica bacterium]|nr:hypothetical protein [Candidatus Omnitrophota bacterium]